MSEDLSDILEQTLLIIPAHNEEAGIASIVQAVRQKFAGLDVVVVDDGSSDDTAGEAQRAGAKVLSLVNNMGYGIALQTGYKYAASQSRYKYCIQMDGDGQHNYLDIPKLLTPLHKAEADLAIGSRFIGGRNGYHIPLARRLGIWFFRSLVRLYTRQEVRDITSGLQGFNRRVLQFYTSDELPYYYPDADVLILLIKSGVRIKEVSTPMQKGKGGSMHDGLWSQAYYVATMVLSILVILLKREGSRV